MTNTSNRITGWCEGETWCPVTCTAMLLGKKWHSVILYRLLNNQPCRFSELNAAIDGISSKALSVALTHLEDNELVDREIVNEKPVRVNYSLTEQGEALESVIQGMYEWGMKYLAPPDEQRIVDIES